MNFRSKILLQGLLGAAIVGAVAPANADVDPILKAKDPVAALRSEFNQMKSVYAQAELRLANFDRSIEKGSGPIDLLNSPEYRAVSAMHLLRERHEDRVAALYETLTAQVQTANLVDANRLQADQLLREINAQFNSSNVQDRLVFGDLKEQVAGQELGLIKHDEFTEAELTQAHAQFVEQAKSDQLMPEMTEIDQALEKIEPKREPEVGLFARIGPSTGAGGSISGSEFPRGTWALTYDDGPHPTYTMQDVANVRANGARATFFWLARNTSLYPGVIRGVQAAGLPVEDHSWNHPILNSPKSLASLHTTLQHEIVDSSNTEATQYGVRPRFFRCPYGAGINNAAVRKLIAQQGMVNVFWNVDSLDWQDHNPSSILARVRGQMARQGRGIILFHDIHPQSVTASNMVMQSMRGSVNWGTIPEIVDRVNGGR